MADAENTNSYEPLEANQYEELNFEQKDNILYTTHEKYIYRKHPVEPKFGVAYICQKKLCLSKVFVRGDKCFKIHTQFTEHRHETQEKIWRELSAKTKLKAMAADLSTFDCKGELKPIRDIFDEVMIEYPDVQLDFKRTQESLSKARQNVFRKNCETCKQIQQTINKKAIEWIGMSKHPSNRLLYDGMVNINGYQYSVFSSKFMIELIQKHIPTGERYFMTDATQKIRRVGPFEELLIIYVVHLKKKFPFIFVLMPYKTQCAYKHIFQHIKSNIFDLSCKSFIVDYETPLRNAIITVYPGADLVSCWYHYCQAIKRCATQIDGFVRFIGSDVNAMHIIYRILCVPWLPLEHIASTVDLLKQYALATEEDCFRKFFNYYERQWMIKEGAERISHYAKDICVASSLASHGETIGNILAENSHFFRFALTVRAFECEHSIELQRLLVGNDPADATANHDDRNENIQTNTKLLNDKAIWPMEFLIRMVNNDDELTKWSFDKMSTIGSYEDQHQFDDIENVKADAKNVPQPENVPQTPEARLIPPGMCSICFENPVIICCIPCGHVATCQPCWDSWKVARPERDTKIKCPVCSKPVAKTINAYFPTI